MKKDAKDKNPFAVGLGKLGGSVISEAKAKAVRQNGKKGGWHTHKKNIKRSVD